MIITLVLHLIFVFGINFENIQMKLSENNDHMTCTKRKQLNNRLVKIFFSKQFNDKTDFRTDIVRGFSFRGRDIIRFEKKSSGRILITCLPRVSV